MTFPYPARTMAEVDAGPPAAGCRVASLADTGRMSAAGASLGETLKAGRPLRHAPADFADLCASLTQNQLTAHYGCGSPLIKRWCLESGVSPQPDPRGDQTPPADLAERAAEMHCSQLARHYGTNETRMRRMLRTAGIEPRRFNQRAPKAGLLARTVRPAAFRSAKQAHSFDSLRRDVSTEGLAADHLRHWQPVYRCTERGGVPERALPNDPRLTHWRCGNAVMTGAELIERAKAKGWSPDAWRHLAPANDTERQRMAQREA